MGNDIKIFAEEIASDDCQVMLDSPMKNQTTFRAGGNADVIAFPSTEEALINVISKAKKACLDFCVIGNGSNLLVKDCGIRGVVIKTTSLSGDITIDGTAISCKAGISLSKLCMMAYENSLTGLEFAYGIPGTVGGAVYMNAGAYGGEINDVISSATHITPDGTVEKFGKNKLKLSYRHSFYSDNPEYVITGASFILEKGDKNEIKEKMNELMTKRKDKQPLEYPSAGSTFKRPEGYFAGALIEECGLKGYSIGGAQVSEKHAGFVINKDNGTSQDILNLISFVQKTVKEKTGVTLEPEVKIIP